MELKEQKEALVTKLGELVDKLNDESADKEKLYKEIKATQGALKATNELLAQEKSKYDLDPLKSSEQALKVRELEIKEKQLEEEKERRKKDMILEIAKIVVSIVVPVVGTVVPWVIWRHGMQQSIIYEETGNYTTAFGKSTASMKPSLK